MEEFGYSDSGSYCSSSDSDVDHGDVDGDADGEVNHHVKEDNRLPGGSRKRTRDGAKEDGACADVQKANASERTDESGEIALPCTVPLATAAAASESS
ncbi:hypothetical protein D9C73_009446 [Collichthys lucidus]|uniref:Uncharacterized protein n=1 Tax=Collichthys lucidus TaxID=240159 RepID=A0A4V6APE6_COLLU|nr:hypothetical protein D9C73_009446 [Collichthys lucidus]